jgi:lipopolysaccharide heptosyltransferase I
VSGAPRAIAIVKLSALGDVVHATPVVEALADAFPSARISWLVERREAALLRDHPRLHEVVVVDTRGWRRTRTPRALLDAARSLAGLGRRLRAARFDVALDLQGLVKSGLVTAATGAPLRIGFAAAVSRERLNALFTNRRVTPPPAARHVVDQYLALLRPLGVVPERVAFRLPASERAESRVEEVFGAAGLKPHGRVVVLNPGAGRPDKRWPVERFAALAARLVPEARARVLVVWGPGEEPEARAVAAATPAAVLAPPTDLAELVALVRRASVLVAGDTGPLHVAAAVGTPCVGLYGPTAAARNGPYGAGHHALSAADGRLASIGVETVLTAVREVLGP